MQKNRLTLFTVLILLLALPFTVYSASATVSTFTVSQSSQIQFPLPAGTAFNGSISVSSTLRFWVNAPSGYQIINLGLIDQSEAFGFVAQEGGNYTMNFENGLPNANPVTVTFTYTTNPNVTSNNNSSGIPLAYWVAILLTVIVGATWIIFLRYRKEKNRDSNDHGEATSNPPENLPDST